MSGRRILVATWDGGGNVGPAVHLGQRLHARGHRVRVLGWASMERRVREAGLEFATYPSVPPWPEGLRHEDGWERIEEALFGEGTARDILAAAVAERPDVLVLDCMLRAGLVAARRLAIPSVALVHVMYRPFVAGWGDEVLGTNVGAMLGTFDRVLALTPPGLDAGGELPANTAYVGAITRPEPFGAGWLRTHGLGALLEPGDPWVLLSLGTTLQQQASAVPRILEALAPLRARILLTLADVLPVDAVRVPPNALVRAFVPHEAVLPFVDVVVAHGGLSTITTALSSGVPLVCVPQGREQPINAERVAAVGAGVAVPGDASPARIRDAVAAVLDSREPWRAARRFRDPAAGDEAARIVEELVARPRAVGVHRAGRAGRRLAPVPVRG